MNMFNILTNRYSKNTKNYQQKIQFVKSVNINMFRHRSTILVSQPEQINCKLNSLIQVLIAITVG